MTAHGSSRSAELAYTINAVHITRMDTGYVVEHQFGTGKPYAPIKTVRHAVVNNGEAFRLARELMDQGIEETEEEEA